MRSYWLTGWLLAVLLACSAVDPRAAMADAPAVPTSRAPRIPHDSQTPLVPTYPALPARPDPNDQQFRAVFTLSGYTRAQKIEELASGWSGRKHRLIHAVEWANRSSHSLSRAAASVLHEVLAFCGTGRTLAEIRPLATPAISAPAYLLSPLQRWLQAACIGAVILSLGLAVPVIWLVRRHATPAPADADGSH